MVGKAALSHGQFNATVYMNVILHIFSLLYFVESKCPSIHVPVCVCVVSVCLNSLRVSMCVGIAEDVSPNLA